jgi:hypothetical protein
MANNVLIVLKWICSDFSSLLFSSFSSMTESVCAICEHPGSGLHFGTPACRACAAFFRRTIAGGHRYICNRDGNCLINKCFKTNLSNYDIFSRFQLFDAFVETAE